MKEVDTNPGKSYSVHSSAGCTVSDDSGWSKTLDAPEDYFTAHGSKVYIDNDAATVRELFKLAPYQKLHLLGVVGGNDGLPNGYTRLAYLGAKQFKKIDTLLRASPETGAQIRGRNLWNTNPYYSALCGVNTQFLVLGVNTTSKALTFAWSTEEDKNAWLVLTNGLVISSSQQEDFKDLLPLYHGGDFRASLNFGMSGKWEYTEDQLALSGELPAGGAGSLDNICLFCRNMSVPNPIPAMDGFSWRGIVYSAVFSEGKKIVRNFIPALDSAGVPCMLDTVTRTPFYNSGTGAFIAGIEEQKQLDTMLHRLPDRTGQDVGTLQVRLAAALQTPENEAKLDAMLAKNWEISQAA